MSAFPLQLIFFLNDTDDNKVICREFFYKKSSCFYFRCHNDSGALYDESAQGRWC